MGSTITGGALASAPSGLSALEIITNAFAEINVFTPGMAIPDEDSSFALGKLNRMVGQWSAKKQMCYYYAQQSFAWITSKTSYTIGGTSADFDADRPLHIHAANLILTGTDPDMRRPMDVFNVTEFAHLSVPSQDAEQPYALYYCPTWPNGTLYPYPYPSNTATALANKIELFYLAQLSEFSDLATVISLPLGYEEAMTLSLAETLCIPYEKTISDDLKTQARQARAVIASVNLVPPRVETRDFGIPTSEAY